MIYGVIMPPEQFYTSYTTIQDITTWYVVSLCHQNNLYQVYNSTGKYHIVCGVIMPPEKCYTRYITGNHHMVRGVIMPPEQF